MSDDHIGSGKTDSSHQDGQQAASKEEQEHPESQRDHRLAKIEELKARGINPYPFRYAPDATLEAIRSRHGDLQPGQQTDDRVKVAGRLMLIRRQGGLTFATLQDRTGHIQLFVDTKVIGPDLHHDFDSLDRGDWVGAEGTIITTRRGELSIRVGAFELLGKAVRPLPDKYKGLADVDTRYRQRYVDLVVNEKTRRIFQIRRKAIQAVREYLESQGFWEVEGPMLQTIQGGASARPFITHHNALDLDLYLRIALELHLKRLIVGGMERVFEIGRVFRNEGIDTHHNPEFTMLEAYQAYADYHDMMDLTEGIISRAARAALGENLVVQLAGKPLDLTPPWPRITMADLIRQKVGVEMNPGMPVDAARKILDDQSIPYELSWGSGKLMKQLYDEKVQFEVRGPVFCMDYPREVSPLARAHRTDPNYVERFELIVGGFELCNAYSEQNNPEQQLQSFEAEARAKEGGDPEAGDVDYDYVRALEYGMPCTGGLGIGMDRMVMLLASVDSIREVILFPTLRPEFALPPGLRGPGGEVGPGEGPSGDGAGAAQSPAQLKDATVTGLAHPPLEVAQTERPPRRSAPRLLGALTALGGIISLLTLVPFLHSRFGPFRHTFGPLWFQVTGHVVTLILGIALLFLADQLAKGKHRAWQVAVVLFSLGFVSNILKGPHPVSAVYCLGMAIALVVLRHRFSAPADPPSLFHLLRRIPIYLGAVIAFGFISLLIERSHISPPITFGGGLETIVKGLVGVEGPYTYHRRFFAEFFPAALLTLGILGMVGLVVLLFRPLRARRPHSSTDWDHVERLVHQYGWDTLAYFALRDDKSFFFSSDGEAMVAFTYIRGYALVSGDPVGRAESIPLVVDEFLTFCAQRAWNPAFLAIRESDLPLYSTRGFHHFYLGDEAIIHCDTFTLEGHRMKGVREAVRRVARHYHFKLLSEANASPQLVEKLNAISAKWRGKAPERGFTMSLSQGVEGNGKNQEFLLAVALDDHNVPGGFLRIVPAYGQIFGYTLDLMRHDPTAPNGMTEFLISQTALALKERRVVRLSMNFAVWGRLFESDVHYSFTQRIAKKLVSLLNPFFQIKSLHDFNEKFLPQWLPRVLAYREPTDLPKVGLLYAGAEGFLALPGIGPLFVPKSVGGVPSPSEPQPRAA